MNNLLRMTVAAAVIAAPLFVGCGVASTDDYTGQTYADQSKAISDAKLTAVIATRAGDVLNQNNCIVTGSEMSPWFKGDDFSPVTDAVLLNLNCNGGVAAATPPGNSAASPAGRAAIQAVKDQAAKDQAVKDQAVKDAQSKK